MIRRLPWFLVLAMVLALPLGPAWACPEPSRKACPEPSRRVSPGSRLGSQSAEPPQDVFHLVDRGETLLWVNAGQGVVRWVRNAGGFPSN